MKKSILSFVMCVCLLAVTFMVIPPVEAKAQDQNIKKNMTWENDTIDVPLSITGGTISNPIIFQVKDVVKVNASINVDGYVKIIGGGTLFRGQNFTDKMINVNGGTLTLQNITIDGGAVWNSGEKSEQLGRMNDTNSRVTYNPAVYVQNAGTVLNLNKGAVIQNNNGSYSKYYTYHGHNCGGIYACSGTAVNMAAGSVVRNNRGANGAGVSLYGAELNIDGGGIYACTTKISIKNANIHNNVADTAGGVEIYYGSKAEIKNSKICNNYAAHGGGIVVVSNSNVSLMNNTVVMGNEATSEGGGIKTDRSESIKLSGKVQITGNKTGDVENNVYLPANIYLTIDSVKQLAEGSKIGVTTYTVPTKTQDIMFAQYPVTDIIKEQQNQSGYFIPDNAPNAQVVHKSDNKLYLKYDPIPAAPTLKGKTENSIVVNSIKGFEYSIDGGEEWQTETGFYLLEENKKYSIIQRMAAKGNEAAGEVSKPLVVKTGTDTDDNTDTKKPATVTSNSGIIVATATQVSDTSSLIRWTKVDDAEGYLIYSNPIKDGSKTCKAKLVNTVEGNKTNKWTMKI